LLRAASPRIGHGTDDWRKEFREPLSVKVLPNRLAEGGLDAEDLLHLRVPYVTVRGTEVVLGMGARGVHHEIRSIRRDIS